MWTWWRIYRSLPIALPSFFLSRAALLRSVSDTVNPELLNLPHDHLSKILLFGSTVYNEISNKLIVEATIRFVKKSKRFKTLEAFSEINNPYVNPFGRTCFYYILLLLFLLTLLLLLLLLFVYVFFCFLGDDFR